MRKVVDSNYLQATGLRDFLSKSPRNYAVLTDYASMEAYKGNTLATIYKSMGVLASFPNQVVILKGTQRVCGLKGHSKGLQRRLIDERQTREFGNFCTQLAAAKKGDEGVQKRLLELGKVATAQMNRMLDSANDLPSVFEKIAGSYTSAELHTIRTHGDRDSQLTDKIIAHIMFLATLLFRNHPKTREWPKKEDLSNTFIFRSAVCAHVLALSWLSVGGARKVKTARLRNDLVDIMFAAYATYFDGILTEDRKLSEIYSEAKCLIDIVASTKWS